MIFSTILIDWYNANKRDLPWRKTENPYEIWVSEIVLQQTRIEQGLPYYHSFLAQFPNVDALANASLDEVLKVWQGLGYYSRARNMHAAAKQIQVDYNSVFPNTFSEILKLKGVGNYTAAAIASFAFKEYKAVVDGNVIRFISRYLGVFEDVSKKANLNIIEKFVSNEILKSQQADIFNQAIMELGALVCTPQNPACSICPFNKKCIAFAQNKINDAPFFAKKTKKQVRYFHYVNFIIHKNNTLHALIGQREEKDIWLKLFEIPLYEKRNAKKEEILHHFSLSKNESKHLLKKSNIVHQLSHRELKICFWEYEISFEKLPKNLLNRYSIIPQNEIFSYAMPVPLLRYFEQKLEK